MELEYVGRDRKRQVGEETKWGTVDTEENLESIIRILLKDWKETAREEPMIIFSVQSLIYSKYP